MQMHKGWGGGANECWWEKNNAMTTAVNPMAQIQLTAPQDALLRSEERSEETVAHC